MKEGEEISPKYLTLLKVLRRGLRFALLTGRGLLLQVLQGEKGTNQNGPSPQTDPCRGRVGGHVFVPEWLCFLKSSSPLRTNRLFWHFVLSPRSRMKGCSCLQTYKHFQEVAASFSSRVFETEAKTDGKDTNRKWLSVRVTPPRYHPPAPRRPIQMRCQSARTCGSPLLLSGLWSDLASLLSRWDAAAGSGVGLVLQLFSCFTGDESAMELWLLLSSAETRRPAVVQTCRETDNLTPTA